MADIIQPNRVSAQIDGDFVVFLIGMRINKVWKVHKWLPPFKAMLKMLRELIGAPAETGFLGFSRLGPTALVQYWRSFAQLERYARSRDHSHWPAWIEFNRQMKDSRGDVGIWHETYLVRSGQYEAIYSGMPLFGLAKAGRQARVTEETESARQRLKIN